MPMVHRLTKTLTNLRHIYGDAMSHVVTLKTESVTLPPSEPPANA